MGHPVIKAKTPEECRDKIVNFLKSQANIYRAQYQTADKALAKREARVKADVCMGIALFLGDVVITNENGE